MQIRFTKKIYTRGAIQASINAFDHLADFAVVSQKDAITVTIENIDKELIDVLKGEFCNFVLAELKR